MQSNIEDYIAGMESAGRTAVSQEPGHRYPFSPGHLRQSADSLEEDAETWSGRSAEFLYGFAAGLRIVAAEIEDETHGRHETLPRAEIEPRYAHPTLRDAVRAQRAEQLRGRDDV